MGMSVHGLHRTGLAAVAAVCFALGTAIASPAWADPKGAAEFVQRIADDLIERAADKTTTTDELERILVSEFESTFDLATISRYTLGRYWQAASADERTEYRKLFARYLVHKYVRLAGVEYAGERLEVTGSRAADESNALVESRVLRPSGEPISVVWQVREADGRYRVVDSVVEGISLVRALREEFVSVVHNNGDSVEKLIVMMRGVLDKTS